MCVIRFVKLEEKQKQEIKQKIEKRKGQEKTKQKYKKPDFKYNIFKPLWFVAF